MSTGHPYPRHILADAVGSSRSWRGVLRCLGRPEHSAGALRVVRREVAAFGIDHSHFTGQRRWSDSQLNDAVSRSRSWSEVMRRLGVSGGNHVSIRTHAARLRIDTTQFERPRPNPPPAGPPALTHLRVAGPTLAAAWFMLRGYPVLWPLEPCRYDLVIHLGDATHRVQVKTATFRQEGSFVAQLSNSRRPGHRDRYDVGEIDSFFVIDADLNAYWIPFAAVSGYGQISLRSYRKCLVAEHGQWLTPVADAAG
jgi:hypothetical protein